MTPAPIDLNTLPLDALYRELTRDGSVRRLLTLARDEDLGDAGDITSIACFPDDQPARAHLVAREPGVIAGLESIPDLLAVFAPQAQAIARTRDGERVAVGEIIADITGPTRQVLALERTMLNLMSRLSGIATTTSAYAQAILRAGENLPARVLDTRKTVPGLRSLSKYSVRCGGGLCHRVGLFDAMLVKDNHIAHLDTDELRAFITNASRRARATTPLRFVEVEVTTLDQLDALLDLPPGVIDIVLLDNMGCAVMAEAVRRRDARAPRVQLEASGGVTLETISDIARTGVDRLSVGAITHSARALDLALDFA